jgi:hypothetical protein
MALFLREDIYRSGASAPAGHTEAVDPDTFVEEEKLRQQQAEAQDPLGDPEYLDRLRENTK